MIPQDKGLMIAVGMPKGGEEGNYGVEVKHDLYFKKPSDMKGEDGDLVTLPMDAEFEIEGDQICLKSVKKIAGAPAQETKEGEENGSKDDEGGDDMDKESAKWRQAAIDKDQQNLGQGNMA